MNRVAIVGGGPGDEDLLTLKARRELECAGCVVYDPDIAPALLELAPRAELVAAGESAAVTARTVLGRLDRGLSVARLVKGDPMFSRPAVEEARALAAAGVRIEIVPGIGEASAAAAYAGVALVSPVRIVDARLPAGPGTVVITGGTAALDTLPAEWPALAVGAVASPAQRSVSGAVSALGDLAAAAGLTDQATVIAGPSVAGRGGLNWYESLPLFGLSVIVTRGQGQAAELSSRLRAAGAESIEVPAIEIQPAADPGPLDDALAALDAYDWLIFTSANGVRFFLDRLDRSPWDLRRLRARIAAIGPATRRAVEQLHLKVDLMPAEYVAESLLEAFAGEELKGKRVLLPRAAVARDLVPSELRRRGAFVDVVEAYRSAPPANLPQRARAALDREPGWITFTSSSTAANMLAAAGRDALRTVRIASIGPVTSSTVRSAGLQVHAEAREYTIDGLVAALTAARNG